MQSSKVYWKRAGYVAIQDRSGKMIAYGGSKDSLDFRFEGEKVGDICPRFKVGILGLSMNTISQLTVWNPAEAVKQARKIQVFAGYEKDSLTNPLFEGYVFSAMPTNPPEMWLNFDCLYSLGKALPIEKQYTKEGTLGEIAKEIADKLDMRYRWAAENVSEDKKGKFTFTGCRTDLTSRFSSTFGVSMFNNNGVLTVCDVRGWYGKPKNPVAISTATGMIGVSNVSLKGALIRRRLDDTAELFSWVKLDSAIVPSANGNYFVVKKRHVGHFRGDDWYTELDTIRKQN